MMPSSTPSRALGVLSPLMTICSGISGPALGIILAKDCPSPAILWAFFLPVSTLLLSYFYLLFFKTHYMLPPTERMAVETMIAQKEVMFKGGHAANTQPLKSRDLVSRPIETRRPEKP
jgi:hypothetical protein